jgi:hypothetical protein
MPGRAERPFPALRSAGRLSTKRDYRSMTIDCFAPMSAIPDNVSRAFQRLRTRPAGGRRPAASAAANPCCAPVDIQTCDRDAEASDRTRG